MKKTVYLTIDDSPSKNMSEKIDYLLKRNIPAIFFSIGHLMEKDPDAIVYAIKKGFIIGNHSYNHSNFSKINLIECLKEIKKTDEIIERLYIKANKKREAKLFRFPYGDKGGEFASFTKFNRFFSINHIFGRRKKIKIQEFLGELGYKQPLFDNINYDYYKRHRLNTDKDVFWTYDFEEYRLPLEEILKRMEDKNPRQGGSLVNPNSNEILLIHDHDNTKEQFFQIIDKLIEKKFKFKLPKF